MTRTLGGDSCGSSNGHGRRPQGEALTGVSDSTRLYSFTSLIANIEQFHKFFNSQVTGFHFKEDWKIPCFKVFYSLWAKLNKATSLSENLDLKARLSSSCSSRSAHSSQGEGPQGTCIRMKVGSWMLDAVLLTPGPGAAKRRERGPLLCVHTRGRT